MTIISLLPTMIKIPPGAPTPTGPDRWEAGKPRNRAIDSRSADAEVLLIIKTIVIVVILTIVIMINDYDNLIIKGNHTLLIFRLETQVENMDRKVRIKETRTSNDECSTGDQTIIVGLQMFLDH